MENRERMVIQKDLLDNSILLIMFSSKQIFLKKRLHMNISLALLQLLVLCMKVLVFLLLRLWRVEHQLFHQIPLHFQKLFKTLDSYMSLVIQLP